LVSTNGKTDYLYECMFLVDSARYASDHEGVMNELTAMLEKAGGAVVVSRPWQDGRLAYEIDGHRKGTHILFLLKMPGTGVNELARSVRLSDLVIRHLVIRHSETLFEAMASALSPDSEVSSSDEGEESEESAESEQKAEAGTE